MVAVVADLALDSFCGEAVAEGGRFGDACRRGCFCFLLDFRVFATLGVRKSAVLVLSSFIAFSLSIACLLYLPLYQSIVS